MESVCYGVNRIARDFASSAMCIKILYYTGLFVKGIILISAGLDKIYQLKPLVIRLLHIPDDCGTAAADMKSEVAITASP